MKLSCTLPFAGALLIHAFVIPDDHVLSQVAIETNHRPAASLIDYLPSKNNLEVTISKLKHTSKNVLDQAFDVATRESSKAASLFQEAAFDTEAWLNTASLEQGQRTQGHHCKPNLTVYQLIAESKYTTKLAEAINEYPDLVQLLNGTAANYTVFAPIDKAFEKIPEDAPKPSKELLKKVLTYHVSSDFYPAGKVLVTHTVPTLLKGEALGGEPQRLSTNIGLRGLTVNFYSRIIAIDIFGTNGVIHGVDSLLIPPPSVADVISFLPGDFSTLELGLIKTGLLESLNDTSNHVGGTVFAPSNFAFQKLGPKINGFLFSSYGLKYLKALLKYHVVANQTLYSDAFYKADSIDEANIPKGVFHVDLPTLLDDKSLSIDVARFGRLIEIKINAFTRVAVEDGIAKDGVIQVVSNVIVPPKGVDGAQEYWNGEELTEEDLIERLQPYVEQEL